jgi:hypothetical protein
MSGCEGFTDVSGANSVPVFRVCWWFRRTKTVDYVANSALFDTDIIMTVKPSTYTQAGQ